MLDRVIHLVTEFAYLFRIFTVIRDYERAVVLRAGKYHRTLGPGAHWVLPLAVDEVICETVTPRTTNLPKQTLETSDGVQVTLSWIVRWRVVDIRKFLLESPEHSEIMLDSTLGAVSEVVGKYTYDELHRGRVRKVLLRRVRDNASVWGIRVQSIQLQDRARSQLLRWISA